MPQGSSDSHRMLVDFIVFVGWIDSYNEYKMYLLIQGAAIGFGLQTRSTTSRQKKTVASVSSLPSLRRPTKKSNEEDRKVEVPLMCPGLCDIIEAFFVFHILITPKLSIP